MSDCSAGRTLGELLDAWDVGGWLLLITGLSIVSVAAVIPATLDVERWETQRAALQQRLDRMEQRTRNYRGLIDALERGDPLLLRRLGWHYLRLKPKGTRPVDLSDSGSGEEMVRLRRWVAPSPPRRRITPPPRPESQLVKLVTGEQRPWALALGGWLMLCGLLVGPTRKHATGSSHP